MQKLLYHFGINAIPVQKIVGASLVPLALTGCSTEGMDGFRDTLRDNVPIVGAGIGIATAALCSKGENLSTVDSLKCLAIGAVVGTATYVITNAVLNELDEQDQREALAAASDALETGEPTTVTLPSSGATVTVSPVPATEDRHVVKSQEILVDTAQVSDVEGTFEVVGVAQNPQSAVTVRAGPGANYPEVATIEPGTIIHAFGRHETEPWYLVGLGVESDFYQEPMAVGFVDQRSVASASAPDGAPEIDWVKDRKAPESAELVEVSWIMRCQDLEFSLQKEGEGQASQEVSSSCTGPTGIPVSA